MFYFSCFIFPFPYYYYYYFLPMTKLHIQHCGSNHIFPSGGFFFFFKMFMHTGSYKDVQCLDKSSPPRLLLKWDTWTDFSKSHDLLCLRRSCQHTQERSRALQACKQLIQTKQKWFLSKHTDLAQGVILLWYWPRLGLQFNM